MSPDQPVLILCTCPDAASADRLADLLVRERLAACVNRIGGVRSTYRWEGEVEHAEEMLLLIKTRGERVDALQQRLKSQHPYDVPEILTVPITGGERGYLDWIAESTA